MSHREARSQHAVSGATPSLPPACITNCLPRGPADAGGNWLSQGQDGQQEWGRQSGAHQSGGAGPPTARCLPKAKRSPTPGQRPHGCNFQDGALTEPCSHASELCQQDTMVLAWEGPRRPAGNPALTSQSCQKPGHQGTREPIPCQLGAFKRKAFTDSNCLRGWGPGQGPHRPTPASALLAQSWEQPPPQGAWRQTFDSMTGSAQRTRWAAHGRPAPPAGGGEQRGFGPKEPGDTPQTPRAVGARSKESHPDMTARSPQMGPRVALHVTYPKSSVGTSLVVQWLRLHALNAGG